MSPPLIAGRGTEESQWQNWGFLRSIEEIDIASLVPREKRAVFVAPHPDDEILGSGGLMSQLHQIGRQLLLIAVTDGTQSHPGSTLWTPAKLAAVRPTETLEALNRLGININPDQNTNQVSSAISIVRAGFEDGNVASDESSLTELLKSLLREQDVVFSTWQSDGHPDHDATGRAVANAARATHSMVVELPIWTWHWATPDDPRVPWKRARKVRMNSLILERKKSAIQAFQSQLHPDTSCDADAILPEHVLARLVRSYEIVFL